MKKTLHRTLAAATLVVAGALAAAPLAIADPGQGVDPYHDVSDQFDDALDPGAWIAPGSKYLVISRLGTNRIECRGDGQQVAFYNCVQRDAQNIVSQVRPLNIPFRNLYVNF